MTKSADSSAPVGVVAPQADARTLKAARVTPRSVSPMETDPPMACAANMAWGMLHMQCHLPAPLHWCRRAAACTWTLAVTISNQ